MSLILRGIKGSALTHAELDNNQLWLKSRDIVSANLVGGNLVLTKDDSSNYTVYGLVSADTFTTSFTYNNANLLTISQNQGQIPLNVTIDNFTGLTINGSLSATTYVGLPIDPDNYVTGGTYSNGSIILDRQNGSITISGLVSADTFTTSFTYNNANLLTISQNQGQTPLMVDIGIMTGLTINGSLSATTISTLTQNVGSSNEVVATTEFVATAISANQSTQSYLFSYYNFM